MSTHELSKEFKDSVIHGLSAFQLIEELLKSYIKYSFKLIRVNLDDSIPFSFDVQDYEKAALGTLTKTFGKLTSNDNLRKTLNRVASQRDYIAHQALVRYIKDPKDQEHHDLHKSKIDEIILEAWQCLFELKLEYEKLNNRIMKL